MITETLPGLGPATVVETAGNRLRLQRADGSVEWAQLALAQPYEPAPGDVVLAIGHEETYVIGVLLGRGRTVFRAPGRLEIQAESVAISGDREIELRSPQITLRGDRVETFARAVFERAVSAYRWIKDALHVRAGRVREHSDGAWTLSADRIHQNAKGDVKIDGQKIRLG